MKYYSRLGLALAALTGLLSCGEEDVTTVRHDSSQDEVELHKPYEHRTVTRYMHIEPSTGRAYLSAVQLDEARLAELNEEARAEQDVLFETSGLVPGTYSKVIVVQDGVNGTNPERTFEFEGGALRLNDASASAGQTQCPGQNITLDMTVRHFFDKASFENVFVEMERVDPATAYRAYDTDPAPAGSPLDASLGLYSYGTLSDGNNNAATATWKFERCTDDALTLRFTLHAQCTPEAGETALVACGDNPRFRPLYAGTANTCRILDERLYCWGSNDKGQLALENTANSTTPVKIVRRSPQTQDLVPLNNVVSVVTGFEHICSQERDEKVRCWSTFNDRGEVGNNSVEPQPYPVHVSSVDTTGDLEDVLQVGSNGYTSCAVTAPNGEVACWGLNNQGQFGNGQTSVGISPEYTQNEAGTANLTGIEQVAVGMIHTCALSSSDEVYCWGDNRLYQIGDGSTNAADRLLPSRVRNIDNAPGFLSGVYKIEAGRGHTCALLDVGEVVCWGYGKSLGRGSRAGSTFPVYVQAPEGGRLSGVMDVSSYGEATLALLETGEVVAWGVNKGGQIGDGTTTARYAPVYVKNPSGTGNLTGAVDVSMGFRHACATMEDRRLLCWGLNSSGQLGNGTATSSLLPTLASF